MDALHGISMLLSIVSIQSDGSLPRSLSAQLVDIDRSRAWYEGEEKSENVSKKEGDGNRDDDDDDDEEEEQ